MILYTLFYCTLCNTGFVVEDWNGTCVTHKAPCKVQCLGTLKIHHSNDLDTKECFLKNFNFGNWEPRYFCHAGINTFGDKIELPLIVRQYFQAVNYKPVKLLRATK